MSITNAKHIIEEIDGVRCTVVEKGTDAKRLAFLKDLLEFNGFEVKSYEEPAGEEEDTSQPKKYTLGVTDIIFNPVFAIYERRLKTRDGHFVTPAIWRQETTVFRPDYWMEGKRHLKKEDDPDKDASLQPFGPLK
jgi:hypothetical protein